MLAFFILFSCSIIKNNEEDSSADDTLQPTPVMVYYQGELLNIFFHPVIAWPEITFNGNMKKHFMEWFVTADEFKKILYELYTNDYVLVDVNETYNVIHLDGKKTVKGQKVLIPEGKKPVVLSIDDLNYYQYMRENGIVHKLVLDGKGEIAAWVGDGELSYDLDIITILEDFIKQYPGFSIRGARGIIALTGYEGVLGYQTQRFNNPVYQAETEKAVVVVNKLKKLGWRFASHSFTHWNLPDITMERFIFDTDRWDFEVRPILGDTDLYMYPFGAGVEDHKEKHDVLRKRNFNLFFGVGYGYYEAQEYIHINRLNIDGRYFRRYRNHPDRLFDIDKVIDRERPAK